MVFAFPASELTSTIITKLVSVATDEVILAWQLDDNLSTLRGRVELVGALISDAKSNPQITKKAVEVWIRQLTQVARHANALLDDLQYRAVRRQVERPSQVRNLLSLFHRFKMSHRIEHINQSMDGIYNRGIVIGLNTQRVIDADPLSTTMENLQMPPTVIESVIEGRQDDRNNIIQMLFRTKRDEKIMSVVAIAGMAGMGKTTLAQMVYRDVRVRNHFRKTIWITVTQNFTAEGILNGMIQILGKTNQPLTLLEALLEKLNELLDRGKFLLVLDDVWNESKREWERLKASLLGVDVQNGSKILVTTRSSHVAGIMQSSIYFLKRLSPEDSWRIFEQKAFTVGGAPKTELFIELGKRMVERCAGVPLAINLLGGLLHNRSERMWSMIETDQCWLTPMEKDYFHILSTSYNHLQPPLLKICFGYCSIFPKNFELRKDVLILLWMALDFLGSSNMEDVGENYFNILCQNSMFHDVRKVEYGIMGIFFTCQMHDLVHDLALHACDKHCLTEHVGKVNDVPPTIVHLRLTSGYFEKIPKSRGECFRRLETLYLECDFSVDIFKGLKQLRVLILSNRKINHIPNTIGNLKHLRYIDISQTSIETLPNSIFDLYLLQTLRVNCLNNLSKKFNRLAKLRHLYFHVVDQSMGCMFMGISALTELQSLPFFVVSKTKRCLLEELGGLNNLTSQLCIYGLEDVNNKDEAKKARLDDKSKISSLEFHWKERPGDNVEDHDEDVLEGLKPHWNLERLFIENFKGKRFASWMMMVNPSLTILRNLIKLRLSNCCECERVPPLGHLHSLEELDICHLRSVKCIEMEFYGLDGTRCNNGAFPSLRMLYISYLPKLQEWVAAVERDNLNVFPCLEVLHIEGCRMLKNVPNHFTSLKELHIGKVGVEEWWFNSESLTRVYMWDCRALHSVPDLLSCTSLQYLTIQGCPALHSVPDLQSSTSLQQLYISDCPALHSVPDLQSFTSLLGLTIEGCPALHSFPDLQGLTNLYSLRMGGFGREVEEFPWPHHLTSSLRDLTLIGWPRVKSLPHPLQHLSSLKYLQIEGFDSLESLPGWLGSLSKLKHLWIRGCPLVEERLREENAPDTHNIPPLLHHAPRFSIGGMMFMKAKRAAEREWWEQDDDE